MDLRDLESAPVKPELIITGDEGAYVRLRWTANLGSREARLFEDLRELLETVQGVEYVKMKRYSASLEIAEHVASGPEMVKALSTVLGKYFEVLGTDKGRTK